MMRPMVMPAALKRPCRMLLPRTRGSFRFASRSCNRSRIGPGTDLDDRRRRVEHDLVEPQNAAVEVLVGIVDRQRRVAGHAGAGADQRRQPAALKPSDPTPNATHASMIPLEIPARHGTPRASGKGLAGELQLRF